MGEYRFPGTTGERPGRLRGKEGVWFTDDIWSMLERCWEPNPCDRPSTKDVLQCLQGVSRSWTPPPQTISNPAATSSPAWNSEPSTEESTDESEVSSPPQTVPSQSSQDHPLKGDPNEISARPPTHEFSALPNGATHHQDHETSVLNPGGSDSEGSAGVLDRVSYAGVLDGFWY